jgi:hypothetical protein
LGGNRYESFSQHWPSTAGADEPDFVELSEQKTVNDPPQRLEKPRHHLKAMLPAPVHKVLLASDPEKLQQQSLTHADALGIREFVQWAKTRDRGGYGDPAAQRAQFALSAIFEGHEPNEATGILGLVGLYLQALFRDWIQEGQSLPLSFRHLAGEELPWLLDCPFAAMDNLCRSAAADVLASLKAQIIMAVTPEEFKGPVEQTLSGQLNRLTLPRTAAFQRQYQHSD